MPKNITNQLTNDQFFVILKLFKKFKQKGKLLNEKTIWILFRAI